MKMVDWRLQWGESVACHATYEAGKVMVAKAERGILMVRSTSIVHGGKYSNIKHNINALTSYSSDIYQ